MHISRASDYGVRAVLTLATLPQGSRASLGTLAAAADAPPAFLSKVLQQLGRGGLVVSRRGKQGGFELAAAGRSASLLDVLEALGGVPVLNACLEAPGCHRSGTCAAHPVWLEAQERVREVLAGASLDRMARVTRAHTRVHGH